MKYLLLALLVSGACQNTADLVVLHDQALALGAYYQPRLDYLQKRLDALEKRGPLLGDALANESVNPRAHAMRQLAELRNLVMRRPDGHSLLERDADRLAREGNSVELARLVAETREKLESGTSSINGELAAGEAWLLAGEAASNRATP